MSQLPVRPLARSRYWIIRLPRPTPRLAWRLLGGLLLLSLGSAGQLAYSRWWVAPPPAPAPAEANLYLLDFAQPYLEEPQQFAAAVRRLADRLQVAPEWLMAVMYAESGFDPGVENHRGSGAIGLIQFMPATARELSVRPEALQQMTAIEQLGYVADYFETVQQRYGPYRDLTDLYLAVLYPKARGQSPCYRLYARPSLAYRQNAGLDENQDGIVTVHDVDRRLLRLFPQAYIASAPLKD